MKMVRFEEGIPKWKGSGPAEKRKGNQVFMISQSNPVTSHPSS